MSLHALYPTFIEHLRILEGDNYIILLCYNDEESFRGLPSELYISPANLKPRDP